MERVKWWTCQNFTKKDEADNFQIGCKKLIKNMRSELL